MKTRLLEKKGVESAINKLMAKVDISLKKVNEEASKQMKRGAYENGKDWANVGMLITDFKNKVGNLRSDWRELAKIARQGCQRPHSPKKPKRKKGQLTPQWEYYHPILRALVNLGGNASKREIRKEVFKIMRGGFTEDDLKVRPSDGRQVWEPRIGRSRKHLAKEGWIESKNVNGKWVLTDSGRKIATTVACSDRS